MVRSHDVVDARRANVAMSLRDHVRKHGRGNRINTDCRGALVGFNYPGSSGLTNGSVWPHRRVTGRVQHQPKHFSHRPNEGMR